MSKANTKPYKEKKVIFDKKLSVLAYLLTLVAAVIARTVQLQTNMSFDSGKYIDSSLAKNYTLWVLIIGFALIIAIMIFGISKDKITHLRGDGGKISSSCVVMNPMCLDSKQLNKKISPKSGAAMFIMAFLIVFDIFLRLSSVANKNKEISTEDDPVFAFAGISVLDWISYVCAIIVIITFISIGSNILKGEGFTRGNCVFLSIYAIWKLLDIFSMIGKGEIVGAYSEKVYIMLTAMASSIFFLYTARFFAGFEKKHTRIWLCIFGYAASILAAVSTLPRYIIYFTKSYEDRYGMSTPDTSDVGIIFITLSIIAVFWSSYMYREMPKLDLGKKGSWKNEEQKADENFSMDSIDEIKDPEENENN